MSRESHHTDYLRQIDALAFQTLPLIHVISFDEKTIWEFNNFIETNLISKEDFWTFMSKERSAWNVAGSTCFFFPPMFEGVMS